MIKKHITEALKQFYMFGWKLYTFNSKDRMPQGMIGWCDHVMFLPKKGITLYIEVKLGNDTLSEAQKVFKDIIQSTGNNGGCCKYLEINSKNFDDIINYISTI